MRGLTRLWRPLASNAGHSIRGLQRVRLKARLPILFPSTPEQRHFVRARIESFVAEFLGRHPRAGTHIPEKGIYEAWIPRTRFVLVYRVEPGDVLRILALYHTSQDRSGFDPDQTD